MICFSHFFFAWCWLRKRFHCLHYTMRFQIGIFLQEPFVPPFLFLFNYHKPRTFFPRKTDWYHPWKLRLKWYPESNSYNEYNVPKDIPETCDLYIPSTRWRLYSHDRNIFFLHFVEEYIPMIGICSLYQMKIIFPW